MKYLFAVIAMGVVAITLYFLVTKDSTAISTAFCFEIVVFSVFYLLSFGHFSEVNLKAASAQLTFITKGTAEAEEKLKRMRGELDKMTEKMDTLGSGVASMSAEIEVLQRKGKSYEAVLQVLGKATARAQATAKKAEEKADEPPRAV